PEVVSDLMREALYLAMVMVSVIIVPSLVIGLIVSVFQAATQINEQTLSFLPRLIITLVTLMVLGPWLGSLLTDFTERLIVDIPTLLGWPCSMSPFRRFTPGSHSIFFLFAVLQLSS